MKNPNANISMIKHLPVVIFGAIWNGPWEEDHEREGRYPEGPPEDELGPLETTLLPCSVWSRDRCPDRWTTWTAWTDLHCFLFILYIHTAYYRDMITNILGVHHYYFYKLQIISTNSAVIMDRIYILRSYYNKDLSFCLSVYTGIVRLMGNGD